MAESEGGLLSHIGLRSATALVIANIIGAGIFTTTGFQAADLGHPGYIFALWIVGGVLAVCGALCFAELGVTVRVSTGLQRRKSDRAVRPPVRLACDRNHKLAMN